MQERTLQMGTQLEDHGQNIDDIKEAANSGLALQLYGRTSSDARQLSRMLDISGPEKLCLDEGCHRLGRWSRNPLCIEATLATNMLAREVQTVMRDTLLIWSASARARLFSGS